MITIYHSGCNCGEKAQLIRRVKAYGRQNNIEVKLLNSKYDSDVRFDHTNWLLLNGLDISTMQPIVVNGNSVVQLERWTP